MVFFYICSKGETLWLADQNQNLGRNLVENDLEKAVKRRPKKSILDMIKEIDLSKDKTATLECYIKESKTPRRVPRGVRG